MQPRKEDQQPSSREARMAAYRNRIRAKLIERGHAEDDKLEYKVEELMHRRLPVTIEQMVNNAVNDAG